ncbi:MAG: HlyD family secretion protein, partial [Bacteroidota bacterium]
MEEYQKNPLGKFIIGLIIGITLLGGGYAGMNFLSSMKEEPPRKEESNRRKSVTVKPVTNDAVATELAIQGRLQAFNKIGLFTEVTGTLKATGRPFKVGTYFPKGAPLLQIDDEETRLSLQAQKATLLNMVAM